MTNKEIKQFEKMLGIKLYWYQKYVLKHYDLKFNNGSKLRIPLDYKKRKTRNRHEW